MYNLTDETKDDINKTCIEKFGISYEELEKLDFDERKKLIAKSKKKGLKLKNKKYDTVMIGSGEHSTFTKAKNGDIVLIGTGEHSVFVEVGMTPEKEELLLNDNLDDAKYPKPVAFTKKLIRRLKK